MGIYLRSLPKTKHLKATATPPFIGPDGNVTKLIPFSHVDTPTMSYQKWLLGSQNQLASFKDSTMKLAIIGAGVGGVTMGFELLRAGFTNFQIFEASDRIGGRFDSHQFPNDAENFAELGAMRFPPTEGCLYYYIQYLQEQYKLGKQPHKITMKSGFPDPGLVPTMANFYTLDYGNPDESICLMNYTWEDWSEKLEALGEINERYQRFLHDLKLIAPDYIIDAMPTEATSENAVMIDWQKEKNYYGAFMLTYPFQEKMLSTMFYSFKEDRPEQLAKVYFVGDSYHWIGGWCEGAFQTSLNAFCAIAQSIDKPLSCPQESPMQRLSSFLIDYGNTASNASVLPFGPVGGVGGAAPFSQSIGSQQVTLYYTNSEEPIINGLKVGEQMYGTSGSVSKTVAPQDLDNVQDVKVYVCQSTTIQFLNTGRVRCFEINGTIYGPDPKDNDIIYEVNVQGSARKITTIMGVSGHDIDRIGFVLST